jgi:hypothetical protein
MCMNGKCGRCGAACKAPEPKLAATKAGPVKGDGLDVTKRNAAEAAVAKARGKRY